MTSQGELNKCIEDDMKAATRQSPNCILKNKIIKYGEKRFSIWQMEFFHPAIWHVALRWHVMKFARWQDPEMWQVALGSWHWIHQVVAPCSVAHGYGMTCRWIRQVAAPWMWHVALGSWHWIRQVAAPCSVAGGSGMTCHWIRPNIRHIGILLLVSISTISPQLTCHSIPVCKILSNSDCPQQIKMMSCRYSRWRKRHLGF